MLQWMYPELIIVARTRNTGSAVPFFIATQRQQQEQLGKKTKHDTLQEKAGEQVKTELCIRTFGACTQRREGPPSQRTCSQRLAETKRIHLHTYIQYGKESSSAKNELTKSWQARETRRIPPFIIDNISSSSSSSCEE